MIKTQGFHLLKEVNSFSALDWIQHGIEKEINADKEILFGSVLQSDPETFDAWQMPENKKFELAVASVSVQSQANKFSESLNSAKAFKRIKEKAIADFNLDKAAYELELKFEECYYFELWRRLYVGGTLVFFWNHFKPSKAFLRFLLSPHYGQIRNIFQIIKEDSSQIVLIARKEGAIQRVDDKFIFWRENSVELANVSFYRSEKSLDQLLEIVENEKSPLRRASSVL